jgi:hypothetical protein
MEKIKQFLESDTGKNILIISIIILVGLGSFELGRLSKEKASSGLKIEYREPLEAQKASVVSSVVKTPIKTPAPVNSTKINFFASTRGNKYYSLGCSAGKTIKQENRIYFESKEEAERAGYELSSGCR